MVIVVSVTPGAFDDPPPPLLQALTVSATAAPSTVIARKRVDTIILRLLLERHSVSELY